MAIGRPKAKRKSHVVKTLSEIAEFFGVTNAAVTQWKQGDNPMPRQRGGYDLSKITQWYLAKRAGTTLSDEQKLVDIRLKTVQSLEREFNLELKKGGYLDVGAVELWAATILIETREQIMALPEILATSCPPEIRDFVRSEADRHCRDALAMLKRRIDAKEIETENENPEQESDE